MFPENPLDRWRLLPLNQVAALKLKEAGEAVSQDNLPVFQLMTWGLDQGVKPVHRRTTQELRRLRYKDPAAAYAYLTAGTAEDLFSLQRGLIRLTPKAAAEKLLELLDLRLNENPDNPFSLG